MKYGQNNFDVDDVESSYDQEVEEIPLVTRDEPADETVLLIENARLSELVRFTYPQSIKHIILFAAPFTLSRVASSINTIVNGFVYSALGSKAAASGGLSGTFVTTICGSMRGALLSTGIIIGKQNGVATGYELNNEHDLAICERVKIGKTLKQSLMLGTLMAIPSCVLLLIASPVLRSIGISAEMAAQTQEYLNANTYGVVAYYWWTSDQQFALGIKRKNIPLVSGLLYTGLTMLVGYSLAFGALGLPKLGVAGLGHGFSIASWSSFLSLRLYFLRNEFKSYHLFDLQLKGIFKDFSNLIKLGLPMGFQALTEWLNLAILTVLIGKIGADASIASLPAIECIIATACIINAISQATSVSMSNQLGQMSEAIQHNRITDFPIYQANIKRLGNAGIITGIVTAGLLGGVLVSIPRQIATTFLSADAAVTEDIIAAAQAMLLINGISFLIDSVRIISNGALSASKDALFSPILSFITMSIIGLTLGGSFSLLLDWGANWLFITRDIGILLAAIGIVHRWLKTDYMPKENLALPQEDVQSSTERNLVSRNSSSFFSQAVNDRESPIEPYFHEDDNISILA